VRDAEALQHLPGLALLIARKREQHVLRADVRRAELARLLVGGEQGGLRVGSERRRHVRPLAFLRLLLELRGDRVGVGVELLQDVTYHALLKRAGEQVVALEVEASPVERRLRRALKEPAGGVAEELRHVDGLGAPRRRLPRRSAGAPGRRFAEEIGEEFVKEAAAAPEATHSLLREVDLAEVFDFLCPVRTKPDPGGDCRSPVSFAKVLDGHLSLLSLGR
jgi:hypothetical protein